MKEETRWACRVAGILLIGVAMGQMVVGAQEAQDWTPEPAAPVATAIGSIEVYLYDRDGDVANMSASADARVLDANGEIMGVRHVADLRLLLTATEKQQLKAMLDRFRALAVERILGQ